MRKGPLRFLIHLFSLLFLCGALAGQTPKSPVPGKKSPLSTFAIRPKRIVWQSDKGVENPDTLLKAKVGQTTIKRTMPPTVLKPGKDSGSVILDFGTQMAGYLEIFTPGFKGKTPRKLRVRFGESVAETCAEIGAVFGHNPVVNDSLDLVKGTTPPTQWINNISSYSMWWVIIHHDWYGMNGDLAYLKEQKAYLQKLLPHLASNIAENGSEALKGPGMRFLDWPTKADDKAVHEGLHAMMVMTMNKGAKIMDLLGDSTTAKLCRDAEAKLRTYVPKPSGRKSPAALNLLAGLRDPAEVAKELKAGGPKDLSTFYGYYVIEALGKAGETDAVLEMIKQYWGGMLDLGATSFWEDFDLEWTKNVGRIDEMVPADKKDIHGDFGAYCYVGFRHSFCHGWAGGPTAFLSHHVLGVSPAAPGFAKVRIEPHLGSLKWAEGTYPTPHGVIKLRHERKADGSIKSEIELPPGVELVD